MFSRNISIEDIKEVIINGEIINSYPEDMPFPSYLLYKTISYRPLHVLIAKDVLTCIVITVYQPDEKIWNSDFKTKR
jgi:hypothetical protein